MFNKLNREEFILQNSAVYYAKKFRLLSLMAIIAAIILFIYSLVNFFTKDYWAAILEFCLFIVMSITYVLLQKTQKIYPYIYFGVVITLIMVFQNFYSGGFGNSGVLLIYIAPLIIYLLVGVQRGFWINSLMFIGIGILTILSWLSIIKLPYDNFYIFMIFVTLAIFAHLVWIYHKSIEDSQFDFINSQVQVNNLNTLKNNFLRTIQKNILSPMSAIYWNSEIMVESPDIPEELKEQAKIINVESIRLTNRMNNVVEAMAVINNEDKITISELEAFEVLEEVIKQFGYTNPDRKINIIYKNSPKETLVRSDKNKLKYIFIRLLDNAVTYSETVNLPIEVSIWKDDKHLIIEFEDKGIGIPEAELDKVFDIFTRATNAKTINADGSGISLYTCKKLSEKLDLKISISSVENEWTKVKVSIPLAIK